jgi:hypothetical protein
VLGEEHPDTLASMNNLALLYQRQGRSNRSEALYIRLLELQERALGADHPRRFASMNDLAWLYLSQARYARAEPLLRNAVTGYQKAATGNWDRYNSESLLGASLEGQNKFMEAEPLLLSGYEGMMERKATIPAASQFRLGKPENGSFSSIRTGASQRKLPNGGSARSPAAIRIPDQFGKDAFNEREIINRA